MSEIQERLNNLKKRYDGILAPKYRKVLDNLEKAEMRKRVLKVGDQMPEFELNNQFGETVNSYDLTKEGPLLITFYRGYWCPYCNIDLNNLQRYVSDIEKFRAKLFAVSPERPDYSSRIIRRQQLTFDILYDEQNILAESFGIKWKLSNDVVELYRDKFHHNLKLFHGNDDWSLPIPARFLIDDKGIIRYANSTPNYSTRPDPDDLLEVLTTL